MEYWLWLSAIKGLGPKNCQRLLDALGDPATIYQADYPTLTAIEGLGDRTARALLEARSLEGARRLREDCQKKRIHILTCRDPLYHPGLRQLDNPPLLLYLKGNLKPDRPSVALVGSRRCSDYGKKICLMTADYLARQGITVVSGMAQGIDGYAHTACLKAGGDTLAFLGSGLDHVYPADHRKLQEAIADRGALLTEYPPSLSPHPAYFPQRNRLISAWSDKVLLVEAGEKSGALITARLAKDLGKEVYVVPNEISRSTGRGANQLILEGARIFLDPSQLLFEGVKIKIKRPSTALALTPDERRVLESLDLSSQSLEVIAARTDMGPMDLLSLLSDMEISGKIRSLPGGSYQALVECEDGSKTPD